MYFNSFQLDWVPLKVFQSSSTSRPSAAKKPSSKATKSLRPMPFGATFTRVRPAVPSNRLADDGNSSPEVPSARGFVEVYTALIGCRPRRQLVARMSASEIRDLSSPHVAWRCAPLMRDTGWERRAGSAHGHNRRRERQKPEARRRK